MPHRMILCRWAVGLSIGLLLASAASGQTTAPEHVHHHHETAAPEGTPAAPPAPWWQRVFEVYVPRQQCMYNQPDVVWTHVVADTGIAASYFSIPVALVYFVRRRRDLAFHWMFLMFALFIVACGTTHVFGVLAIWHPLYRLDGWIKVVTALLSIGTAVAIWPLIPKALALPSIEQLQAVNRRLGEEVTVRTQAQKELRAITDDLEKRVQERTEEMAQANANLRGEIAARTAAEQQRNALLESERSARAEAERLNRVKDEFVATLSHELRTPLNAILGWTHILRHTQSKPEEVSEALEVIERNARLQSQMVEELLDMSRITSGKLRLDMQRVEPVQLIEAVLETVRPAAEAKEIHLMRKLDPRVGPISGDSGRLQQVLWNLLTNAIKFTPRGGQVVVSLLQDEANVMITVADNGHGIVPEFLPFVFERFRQADASASRQHGGLGLGLAIVKHLVELHGGTVAVTSPGLGQGATFTLRFPLLKQRERGENAGRLRVGIGNADRPEKPSLDGLVVLVVDDDQDSRRLLKRLLEEQGALVTVAGSATEALSLLDHLRVRLILSDIGMPGQDGYEFIQRVRQRPDDRGGATPAVAVTAFARSEDRRRALLTGYQHLLAKPVEPAELLAVVTRLVQPA